MSENDATCCKADDECLSCDEVMAKIKPSLAPAVSGPDGAGAVQGPIGDALIAAVEQLAPIVIQAILAMFHVSKKPKV